MNGIRIAHLINPVKVDESRDLHFQQPFTFESMRIAREFTGLKHEVNLYAVVYEEDVDMVEHGFNLIPDYLTRSTLDGDYKIERKLPYFKDMLDLLYEHCDGEDYFIQTNADIGLYPYFYDFVAELINGGEDSFCINKRIVPEVFKEHGLSAIWACPGTTHAGCDCFVFRRELYPKFNIGEIVMGTPWSETTLFTNMVAYADNFSIYKNSQATFHIGDRRIWLPHDYNDYRIHNTNEFARILKILSKKNKEILKHPAIEMQLGKLEKEVKLYTSYGEKYSKDCWKFIR
ncbi:MAG: hypothetical protein ACFFCW_00290 [Candidatus Hodarchaeota archaeon]